MNEDRKNRFLARLIIVLLTLQAVLVLASWLLAAAMPTLSVHSLISGEGVRWFVGNFALLLAKPLLVWIVLLAIAVGAVRQSGLCAIWREYKRGDDRLRLSLGVVGVEITLFLAVIALATLPRNAILLNVAGHLFPGTLSAGAVALLSFFVSVVAVSHALIMGRLQTCRDFVRMFTRGIAEWAPVIVVYVFVAQLFFSLRFVFGI